MSILNKRNAVVGWAVIKLGKRVVKPSTRDMSGPRAGGVAAGTLAALGALLFWRKARGGPDTDE